MNTTCDQCGEVNPADIHTCTPAAQPAPVQEPVAWMHTGGHVQVRNPTWADGIADGYTREKGWTPLSIPPAAPAQEPTLQKQLDDALSSRDFYKRRIDALQQCQSKMRDPERTIVCDIIANGCTLEPAGDRYTPPNVATPLAAPVQEPVAWKNAAIRLGEELSSVGPAGYYDMTAEQWLDWAMTQQPRGKNSLPAAQPAPVPLTLWTEAQHERAYRNSPELHKDVQSLAAFKRVAKEVAAMYGITKGQP